MTATEPDLYYDPYDFEIDADPYPLWRRLREESPLYHNEKYDFFAVSRFDDCEKALVDWRTYSSARGTVLELLKANLEMPPGSIIFEDPPNHDLHRGLLSRVFTPRRVNGLEPKIREYCATRLDPTVGTGTFDFIHDLGAYMPMRTIGMLLGIPEADQEALREHIDKGLELESAEMPDMLEKMANGMAQSEVFGDYVDWRMQNPSDDLMTELLNAEFEDVDGERKKLTREEVLNFINLLSGAGNETTTRLIGWTGKTLAEHPDQLRKVAEDRSLVPNVIEEVLRYEAPSPVQARFVMHDVELHGQTVPQGSAMVVINGSGNRDDRHFEDGDSFDIERTIDHHLSFGYGIHFCLGAALARLEGRIALDEVLNRFPDGWDVDWDNAKQARTSTVRGWQTLPVVTR
ncbi:MAG: cytochrome P450 [Acidimicrobiales bacterium]